MCAHSCHAHEYLVPTPEKRNQPRTMELAAFTGNGLTTRVIGFCGHDLARLVSLRR